MQIHITPADHARFWIKVDKNGPVPEHRPELGPCWVWLVAKDPNGYGRFGTGIGANSIALAHRVAWVLEYGTVPDDLWVLHKCDNPSCVRPVHLFLGTDADNSADMWNKSRGKPGWVPGEMNGNHVLTTDQVREIRHRYVRGVITAKMLARDYGVSMDLVFKILNRRMWKHLP